MSFLAVLFSHPQHDAIAGLQALIGGIRLEALGQRPMLDGRDDEALTSIERAFGAVETIYLRDPARTNVYEDNAADEYALNQPSQFVALCEGLERHARSGEVRVGLLFFHEWEADFTRYGVGSAEALLAHLVISHGWGECTFRQPAGHVQVSSDSPYLFEFLQRHSYG